ncbi:glycosyltransferase family 2 protein [Methylophaga sp.]|uniref:glycosyltransferase family 2 protein n=1 Tax=Methylophaga sp. TaxID=2024840 RepID=UPI0014010720|nr:glycosyltransferase family 2 protein [Methylophaga sp.]MTI64684.1 glycosyltransferase family 2 protein [Methylophaga sp.]
MNSFTRDNQSTFVSVILASFNGQSFIEKQLDSILNQTHPHLELLVVDDGSNDQTLEIVIEYSKHDERVRIFPTHINQGLVKNFERGLKLTKGEFIVLADQDDIFHRDKIEKQLALLSKKPDLDIVISDLELIDERNNSISASMWKFQGINSSPRFPFKNLAIDNYATGCTIMFRRRLLDSVLPFPPELRIHDQWLAIVAAREHGGGIGVINETLTKYRQHHGNVIGAKHTNKRGLNDIRKKLFSLSELKMLRQQSSRLFNEKRLRVSSFLERRELFSRTEIRYLESLESLFLIFSGVSNKGLWHRIFSLPKALYFSFYARSFLQTFSRFVVLTIPQKSNQLKTHLK